MTVSTRPMTRLLVVLPSWVGDAVMATPALRLIRDHRPGLFVGALARPGIDQLLEGLDTIDEFHVERAQGIMGPKLAAAKVRARRYDAALLLSNSFRTALISRLAFIPRRLGYDRDGRGMLLTQRLAPPRRPDGSWAPTPAVTYYWNGARALLGLEPVPHDAIPAEAKLELHVSSETLDRARELLHRAGVPPVAPLAILNPGGNNPAKRWPVDRFAQLADWLARERKLTVLISGAPGEREIVADIASRARASVVDLVEAGVTLDSLKGLLALPGDAERPRRRLMVTNDTGPRHIAAALGVPVITLFGPTDHRWTTIRAPAGEEIVLADPTLPDDVLANDEPERCRIERIEIERVVDACRRLLGGQA